ncbi:type VI secretion system baseplate subunit TssF [Bordetella genomosp. 1]|uniref:Type VI secretion system protein ImpG n=1 Tax=Bordetella genomosp. 1 TaxID=1395607 RepID=A0ABX4EXU0_9BORD|nr:type VI secretion system baseplate subunit TssF [Bordetella genomosp. 1]OZI63845.1 type VI secretion system protein ImpG [Bordetella genomosp. 1]
MDTRLLDYYNRELGYLREMGAEFSRHYPKVAGRLGLSEAEVADPYVERLLEGFSFLTARVQLKMDAEFPRFSQRLLDVVYPHYLAPTPAMAVVALEPSMNEGTLAKGFTLPRGTLLRARVTRGEQTPCDFSTGQDVKMWPLKVAHAEFMATPPDLPLARLGLGGARATAALRLRIEVCGGVALHELDLDSLTFFLDGQDVPMNQLLALVLGKSVGVVCHDADRPALGCKLLPAEVLRHEGFDDDQALLPADDRCFQGYRLMQEYFAFPQRFMFFSVNQLRQGLRPLLAQSAAQDKGAAGEEVRAFGITILLSTGAPDLESTVRTENVALHCVPVINLFPKRADRVAVTPRTHEYHLVVDRTRPLDYEVYGVTRVTGHAAGGAERQFRPFYGTLSEDGEDYGAYYATRREPRLLSDVALRQGSRTGYVGSELFLSLVDRDEAPFSGDLRHLTLDTLCTNRDLPLLMPLAGDTDFSLRISAPVARIKVRRGPSAPRTALADGEATWRLINHLGLNYLSLTDLDPEQGAQTLRETLRLYADLSEPVVARQIEGLQRVRAVPMHQRLPVPGPIVYGRGVRVELTVDETAFSGIHPYLFGAVLERYFTRHVSINMMTELTLGTLQRGEVARWKPRPGGRPAC